MRPIRPASRPRARGFTLIEVLVALTVVVIAVGALARAGSQSLEVQRQLELRTLALWVADNQLAAISLQQPVQSGPRNGTDFLAGREWRWHARVQPAPGDALWRVDVEVFEPQRDDPVLVHTGFLRR